jgi:hypothetical protein
VTCSLEDDEAALQQSGAGAGGASAAAQSIGRIGFGGEPGGGKAGQDASEQRESEGEGQHGHGGAGVDGEIFRIGKCEGEKHAGASVGDGKSGDAA